jgi:arylsulfatase A-like enzyme
MNRKTKLMVSVGVIATISGLTAIGETPNNEPKHPNILFIAVDDMNDWIGPLGGLSIAKTPNLDRLAEQGITFTNAHCASPACAPSRLSIMTGVQPSKTDVMQNVWYDGPEWRNIPVLKDVETMEQFFRNRGYKTLAGGKIYHSLSPPWLTTNQAEPESWDFYFPSAYIPIPYQIRAHDSVIHPEHFVGRRHPWFTWGPLDIPDEKMSDYHVVDWARYELGREHKSPFFLAVGIFRPHMPWEVPRKYFDMYPVEDIPDLVVQEHALIDKYDHGRRHWHKFILDNNQWKHVIRAYLASITFADAQIGRLLDGLNQSDFAENTIVVLWSDHGMHIGEKENWEKFTLWEESTRVPLIFKGHGITMHGVSSSQPASLLDIYPTLAELAGFDIPPHCDGKSLIPQLIDIEYPSAQNALTSFRFEGRQGNKVGHSLRSRNYRYIFYEDNSLEELYDHQSDPNEFLNLAYNNEYREVLHVFRDELVKRVSRVTLPQIIKQPVGFTLEQNRIVNDSYVPLDLK